MARGIRLFVGRKVRQLRIDGRMDQASMAKLLGISISYLSQLENDSRPLTARVKSALAAAFPLDWSTFDERQEEQLLGAFNWALANPGLGSAPPDPDRAERIHLQFPDFAARYVELHHALRQTQQHLAMVEEVIASDAAPTDWTLWESMRDWFHDKSNYVHPLDVAAEDLHRQLGLDGTSNSARLAEALASRHGCAVQIGETEPSLLRALSADGRTLKVNAALPAPSIAFQIASQFMALELGGVIATCMKDADLGNAAADQLLRDGLVNYAAGALLMPYGAFRRSAHELRHDVDRLARRFGVSFEQTCHRLSTLQRPGQRGIAFYFCRVDMAGNISKRYSATRMEFGRFGGSCPLWSAHEAVAIPDRTIIQLAETPDGLRYVSMARGLVKPSGAHGQPPRRHAIVLGCEIEHAAHFIYADGLNLTDEAAATPIGPACRLCPREGCNQRAFPPLDRPIHVEQGLRRIIPYGIG